jgi:hypothetical protein
VDAWRVLSDEQFREKLVGKVRNPIVRQYFAEEFASDSKAIKKVGSPLANDMLLAVLAQRDGLDLAKAMRSGRIVLCDLDEAHLGPAAKTIAGLLLSGIRHAASTRDEHSPPCIVICDEWQMFAAWASQSIEALLELMRKKSISICLASQHQHQFSDTLRRAALLCGNRIIFDAHPEERAGLKREFGEDDWLRCCDLPDRVFAAQWTIRGRRKALRRQRLPHVRWTRTQPQVMEYVKSLLEPQTVYPTRGEVLAGVKLEKKRTLALFPQREIDE